MTRAELLAWATGLTAGCLAGTPVDAGQPAGSEPPARASLARGDTVRVSLARSTVRWKGTKMRGLGTHEGVVPLQRAYLVRRGGRLVGGGFVMDMRALRVTDIPAREPIPLRNLTNHLKGPDFFAVDRHPTARFVITGTKRTGPGTLRVEGALTVKGVTRPIAFTAREAGTTVAATFSFDRFRWNIAYNGSWADQRLVDRYVELAIKLQLL